MPCLDSVEGEVDHLSPSMTIKVNCTPEYQNKVKKAYRTEVQKVAEFFVGCTDAHTCHSASVYTNIDTFTYQFNKSIARNTDTHFTIPQFML